MPKLKSKGAVKRRFKVTKSGKVIGSRTGRGHMHASKDAKSRRANRKQIVLEGTWATLMRRMMGGN